MVQENIKLNFLKLTPNAFKYKVYRKVYNHNDISEGSYRYRLPENIDDDDFIDYSVSLEPKNGYHEFICNHDTNIDLTLKLIYNNISNYIKSIGIEIGLGKKFYDRYINFTLKAHPKGNEIISLNCYYLKELKQFGFIINYSFKANIGEKLDKEILFLSLSLDKDGRSNKNYYSDHFKKLQLFINSTFNDIRNFKIGEGDFFIDSNLTELNSKILNKKTFRFKGDTLDLNQFNGVRKYGAYKLVDKPVKYVFVFEDRFKSFANSLYLSLVGKSNPGTFSGMNQFFELPLSSNIVKRISLIDYSIKSIKNVIGQVIQFRNENLNHKIIVIFIAPNKFEGPDQESPYYNLKFYLTKENIPIQVVRDDQTNNANALKWSTSNIGLQIFSKLGGIPWILQPSQNQCLILGIGSAYEKNEDGKIKKYFAYSVCLDSTGIYKKLDILSEENNKEEYLIQLTQKLIELFNTPDFKSYKKCALHISESVTRDAINSIQAALSKISNIEFKVLKINLNHQFFGYSNHNTYVPYESSYIKLAKSEYLVWFDGLIQGKENIYQKVGNPIHIKFLKSDNDVSENELDYLQDAINLSGANWRGFNARQTPISIYYAKIVADYTAAFSKFEDFEKKDFSNSLPWFL